MLEGRDPLLPPKKLKKRLKLNGFTPLHLAAHHNNVAAIRALLVRGEVGGRPGGRAGGRAGGRGDYRSCYWAATTGD